MAAGLLDELSIGGKIPFGSRRCAIEGARILMIRPNTMIVSSTCGLQFSQVGKSSDQDDFINTGMQ